MYNQIGTRRCLYQVIRKRKGKKKRKRRKRRKKKREKWIELAFSRCKRNLKRSRDAFRVGFDASDAHAHAHVHARAPPFCLFSVYTFTWQACIRLRECIENCTRRNVCNFTYFEQVSTFYAGKLGYEESASPRE